MRGELDGLIKADEIRELLRGDEVIRNGRRPAKNSPAFEKLRLLLCGLQLWWLMEQLAQLPAVQRRLQFADALASFKAAMPLMRAEFEHDLADSIMPVEAAQAAIAALDRIADAVNEADRHIQPALLAVPRALNRREQAAILEIGFHAALPRQKKAAAYRFIAEVLPWVTGENLTVGAVTKQLMRHHRKP